MSKSSNLETLFLGTVGGWLFLCESEECWDLESTGLKMFSYIVDIIMFTCYYQVRRWQVDFGLHLG